MPVQEKKYQEVLAAVREHVATIPVGHPPSEVADAYWAVGPALHMGLHDQHTNTDRDNAQRFWGQVARALNALTAEGVLVKIGKGDTTPQGFISSGARYYTPAQYERTVAEEQQKRESARSDKARWELIWDDLDRHGMMPGSTRGEPVHLTLEEWERITPTLSDLVRE